MDELELLRSLRPEVAPPTPEERERMWHAIDAGGDSAERAAETAVGTGTAHGAEREGRETSRRRPVLLAAAAVVLLAVVVGAVAIRSRGGAVDATSETAARVPAAPDATMIERQPIEQQQDARGGMTASGAAGLLPSAQFGWSSCGGVEVSAEQLAASAWAAAGHATDVRITPDGRLTVVTVAIEEWLRGDGPANLVVAFPFVGIPEQWELSSGWVFGSERVLVAGSSPAPAAIDPSSCVLTNWSSAAHDANWWRILR